MVLSAPPASFTFECSFAGPNDVDTDWLFVPVFEGDPSEERDGGLALDEVVRVRRSSRFSGKRFEHVIGVPSQGSLKAGALVLIGAGPAAEFDAEVARRLGSAAVLLGRTRGVCRLALAHRVPLGPSGKALSLQEWAEAWTEGLTLGGFDPARYRTTDGAHRHPQVVVLAVPARSEGERGEVEAGVARGRVISGCANIARHLVNEPGNLLTPRVLADQARAAAEGTALHVRVLDETEIAALRMGLLAGVARGSHEQPRVIVMDHAPQAAPPAPVLGLVGKGVTFDSGGISIKTSAGMDRMKDDMSGGAAVIAAMRAISLLGIPLHVIGVIPAVENMPSGRALKPGDVLHAASGRTVEVIDTDAEGRLILGDALWYAVRLGATHLVDIATLTGSCAVALGKTTTGLFGQPEDWAERVLRIANREGERCWPLPLFDDYRELLKSEIADTTNVGGKYGGAISAALFLSEFTEARPWVHLDIAGTAWNDETRPYMPKGPTAVGVRTLTRLAGEMVLAKR